MAGSTAPAKPSKPRPDFPLFPHANGRWAKKVRGKLCYFGKWLDDPKGEVALQRWTDEKDDLIAGRKPRTKLDGLTVAGLVNRFLTHKEGLLETGELSQRTWDDYYAACQRVVKTFGRNRILSDLGVDDFASLRRSFAKTHGPSTLATDVIRVRVLFKFAYDEGLIEAPMRYGQSFDKPSDKTLRLARAKAGPRMFERDEAIAMLNAATQPLKSMILLGLNGGLGNTDLALLPMSAISGGWLTFARVKTGIERRIPLWNETQAELASWQKQRPKPNDRSFEDRVFLMPDGDSWERKGTSDPVSKETASLLKQLKLHRRGRSFYSMRRTFRTIASETRDEPAADAIMGHAPRVGDMAAVYRQRIGDDRLLAVTNHVRYWLFGIKEEKYESSRVAVAPH